MDLAALRELAENATPGPRVAGVRLTEADLVFLRALTREAVLALCDVAEAAKEAEYADVASARRVGKALAQLEEMPVK